ncbi:MAG: hypothetical protein QW379_03915 [Thermoplasmata archaeon]
MKPRPRKGGPGPSLKLPDLYIENQEPFSEWLMLEYRHCIESWEGLIFTNVRDERLIEALRPLSVVYKESARELEGFDPKSTLVLDPDAEKPLTTSDVDACRALVVGGILGSEGFTGKTRELVTKKLECQARNLGPRQLSIDSAVVVARLIALGMRLEDIELTSEVEVRHDVGHSTVLPYAYPILNGKVIFTPGLAEYLRKH